MANHLAFSSRAIIVACLCVTWIGCYGKPAGFPDLAEVEGTVTVDGKPVSNLAVAFIPDGGRPSLGITDESGHYQLSYFRGETGAVLGPHKVMITTNQETAPPPGYRDPIPVQYNLKSTLTAEVQDGENVIDFELESKSRRRR